MLEVHSYPVALVVCESVQEEAREVRRAAQQARAEAAKARLTAQQTIAEVRRLRAERASAT